MYLTKACVTSRKDFQVFQAVFFPLPENVETVSQPVKANQSGSPLQTSSPRIFAYS